MTGVDVALPFILGAATNLIDKKSRDGAYNLNVKTVPNLRLGSLEIAGPPKDTRRKKAKIRALKGALEELNAAAGSFQEKRRTVPIKSDKTKKKTFFNQFFKSSSSSSSSSDSDSDSPPMPAKTHTMPTSVPVPDPIIQAAYPAWNEPDKPYAVCSTPLTSESDPNDVLNRLVINERRTRDKLFVIHRYINFYVPPTKDIQIYIKILQNIYDFTDDNQNPLKIKAGKENDLRSSIFRDKIYEAAMKDSKFKLSLLLDCIDGAVTADPKIEKRINKIINNTNPEKLEELVQKLFGTYQDSDSDSDSVSILPVNKPMQQFPVTSSNEDCGDTITFTQDDGINEAMAIRDRLRNNVMKFGDKMYVINTYLGLYPVEADMTLKKLRKCGIPITDKGRIDDTAQLSSAEAKLITKIYDEVKQFVILPVYLHCVQGVDKNDQVLDTFEQRLNTLDKSYLGLILEVSRINDDDDQKLLRKTRLLFDVGEVCVEALKADSEPKSVKDRLAINVGKLDDKVFMINKYLDALQDVPKRSRIVKALRGYCTLNKKSRINTIEKENKLINRIYAESVKTLKFDVLLECIIGANHDEDLVRRIVNDTGTDETMLKDLVSQLFKNNDGAIPIQTEKKTTMFGRIVDAFKTKPTDGEEEEDGECEKNTFTQEDNVDKAKEIQARLSKNIKKHANHRYVVNMYLRMYPNEAESVLQDFRGFDNIVNEQDKQIDETAELNFAAKAMLFDTYRMYNDMMIIPVYLHCIEGAREDARLITQIARIKNDDELLLKKVRELFDVAETIPQKDDSDGSDGSDGSDSTVYLSAEEGSDLDETNLDVAGETTSLLGKTETAPVSNKPTSLGSLKNIFKNPFKRNNNVGDKFVVTRYVEFYKKETNEEKKRELRHALTDEDMAQFLALFDNYNREDLKQHQRHNPNKPGEDIKNVEKDIATSREKIVEHIKAQMIDSELELWVTAIDEVINWHKEAEKAHRHIQNLQIKAVGDELPGNTEERTDRYIRKLEEARDKRMEMDIYAYEISTALSKCRDAEAGIKKILDAIRELFVDDPLMLETYANHNVTIERLENRFDQLVTELSSFENAANAKLDESETLAEIDNRITEAKERRKTTELNEIDDAELFDSNQIDTKKKKVRFIIGDQSSGPTSLQSAYSGGGERNELACGVVLGALAVARATAFVGRGFRHSAARGDRKEVMEALMCDLIISLVVAGGLAVFDERGATRAAFAILIGWPVLCAVVFSIMAFGRAFSVPEKTVGAACLCAVLFVVALTFAASAASVYK